MPAPSVPSGARISLGEGDPSLGGQQQSFPGLLSHLAAVEQIPGKPRSRLGAVDSAAPREPSPSQYHASNMKPIHEPTLVSFFLLGKPRGEAPSWQLTGAPKTSPNAALPFYPAWEQQPEATPAGHLQKLQDIFPSKAESV